MYQLYSFRKNKAFLYKKSAADSRINIGNYFCINTKCEVLFELPKGVYCGYFEEGNIAAVSNYDGKFAIIDSNGNFLCDFIYDDFCSGSEDGFFEVKKNGKYGHIDLKGKEIIPCIYDKGLYFSEGITSECLNGKWGAVDFNNNVVIPFEYEQLSQCYNNLMCAKKDSKWGFIDKFNNVIADFKFDAINNFAKRDCICYMAKLGDKYGFIDRYGNVVEDFIYDCMFLASGESNNFGEFFHVFKDHKWAVYSTVQAKFITDFVIDFVRSLFDLDYGSYLNGFAPIIIDGKYGFVDTIGQFIKPVYEETKKFIENVAAVRLNDKWGAINNFGEVVIPFEYEYLSYCSEGLIRAVDKNNEEGFIDRKNNIVIPFGKFSCLGNFSCGLAKAHHKELGEVYINKNGEIYDENKILHSILQNR